MSEIVTTSAGEAPAASPAAPAAHAAHAANTAAGHKQPWGPWRQQLAAIIRLELRKGFFGGRSLWLYLLAMAPLVILGGRLLFASRIVTDPSNISDAGLFYALIYRVFTLRFVIMLGCVAIFGNLIRREMLDRSLHYYFLSPVRRELLVVGKYLTGLIVSVGVFGIATVIGFVLAYLPHDFGVVQSFLLRGPGLGHLAAYLLVTTLACVGYGAVFLAFGSFVKSPALPALAVFTWEGILFLLPPLLKKISVIHYLQALCPVPIPEAPLALLADPPSPWVAVPGLLIFSAAMLALSAWKIRKMEISYEED